MSKSWEVSYRYKDSLATCNVWASTEEQAEKKFRARKEYEYDPCYDLEADGNIRSIYLTPSRTPKPKKQLDPLKIFDLHRFVLHLKYDLGHLNDYSYIAQADFHLLL